MRTLNRGLVVLPMVLLVFAGCGGGSSNSGTAGTGGSTTGTGGATGVAGTGGATGAAGTGGATGVAGAGGSATGSSGTGGSATGTGGGTGGATGVAGTGGATGAAGTGGSGMGGSTGTGGGTVSCVGTDIDIPSTLVTGTFKINGATVTATNDSGYVSLRTAGGTVLLGATWTSSYSVRAVPGTYDLVYQVNTPGATAPRNTAVKLRSVVVGAPGTTALDIDIPSVVVTGSLKINGVAVTAVTDSGTVTLRNGTDIVTLGSTTTGSYSVRVVPGNYDVYYQMGASSSSAPRNQVAKLQSVVVAATGTTVLDIDIPSVVVSGMLKIGGAAVTATTDAGLISLRNAAGDVIALGNTSTGTYSVRAIPGSYDVYYQVSAPGPMAPRNLMAKVQTVTVAATGTSAIDIDVPAVVTSGTFKIGGAAVTSTADAGNMSLQTADGDFVALGSTSAGTFSMRVVPGTYTLYYGAASAGATAPRNAAAKLQSVTVTPGGTNAFDIDVPSAVAAGTFKINGAAVTSATDSGIVSLRNAADTIQLGSTSASTYSVRAIPGTYDVYYQVNTPGASAPRNAFAKIRSGVVVAAGTTAIDIDVPSSSVTGTFRINSATVTSTTDYGTLSLRSGTDFIPLGTSYASTFTVRVVPGTYDVYYVSGVPGTLAPRNSLAKLRCLAVP